MRKNHPGERRRVGASFVSYEDGKYAEERPYFGDDRPLN